MTTMNPKMWAEKAISVLGYPSIGQTLITRFSNTTTFDISASTDIDAGCRLRGDITIGPESRIRKNTRLLGNIDIVGRTGIERENILIGDITIGKYCAIAPQSVFRQKDHDMMKPAIQAWFYNEIIEDGLDYNTKGPIQIGNDVWIGTRAVILSGVNIGHGAVIGAGAVVTSDVEPYAVVAGNPAERVKWRFPHDVRQKLLDVAWWDWDDEDIRARREFFNQELTDPANIPDV